MTASAIAIDTQSEALRLPSRTVVAAIGLGGCALAAFSLVLALTDEAIGPELGEPFVVALLVNWNTIAYVLCGLVAWSRRPGSRFGVLMVAAGFANFVSTLSWTTNDLLVHGRAGTRLRGAGPVPARLPRVSDRQAGDEVRAHRRRDRVRRRHLARARAHGHSATSARATCSR